MRRVLLLTRFQASQFLIQFSENIDLDRLEKRPGEVVGSDMDAGGKDPISFNPMRRKLQMCVRP